MSIKTSNSVRNSKDFQIEALINSLQIAEKTKNHYDFYDLLKTTDFPFIPCNEKNISLMHKKCFEVLQKIGETSIPVSVALSMHYYILAAMASYPFSIASKEYWKREILLRKIRKERLIIANTGSVRTFKSVSGTQAILAKKEGDNYIINGQAPFMSLSGIADYAVFTAELNVGDKAVFFVPLDSRGIIFEDTAFGDTMRGSFTKSVQFNNLGVDSSNVIQLEASQEERCDLLIYQRSWFQSLIGAPYLGASKAVMEALLRFAKEKTKRGKLLSDSEAFRNAIGELQLKFKAATQLNQSAGEAIDNFKVGTQQSLENMFESSVIAKYFTTHFSEEIVASVRQWMGTAFLAPDALTNKVYKEIVFGPLQPMTDLDIKQYFADRHIPD